VEAHARDLRSEVHDDALVAAIRTDHGKASLDQATRTLLDHAVKLTRAPASVGQEDVQRLRGVGLSDRAIHDATQVIAFFNYINRIADGLGVDPEPDWS
jgi:uncharacterized peroxidase-related enzyme